MVQALSSTAAQEDARVAEYVADQVVHLWLLEGALLLFPGSLCAFKPGRAADHVDQEVADVDRAVLSAEHAVGDTLALNLVAFVAGRVLASGGIEFGARLAFVQVAHEGFALVDPDYNFVSMQSADGLHPDLHWKSHSPDALSQVKVTWGTWAPRRSRIALLVTSHIW